MREKDFLYWLLDEQGRPLIGDVKTLNVSTGNINDLNNTWLKKTPDGWLDVLVKYGRNIKYWGLFRDYTVPMTFIRDGDVIIKDRFWRTGVEAYAKLLILKADRLQFPIKHKTWYFGEIDFSTTKQNRKGTTVNVMEGGLSKLLKANEGNEYEIELDDMLVKMDGFFLNCSFKFVGFHGQVGAKHLLPLNFLSAEGTQLSLAHTSDVIIAQNVADGYEVTSDQWFLKAFDDTTIRIHGTKTVTSDD